MKTQSGRIRRGVARGRRGAAILEFAFIFVLMVILAFGVADYGLAFFRKNAITFAAREGARWGATQTSVNTTVAKIQTRVLQSVFQLSNPPVGADDVFVRLPGGGGGQCSGCVRVVVVSRQPMSSFVNRVIGTSQLIVKDSATFYWEAQ